MVHVNVKLKQLVPVHLHFLARRYGFSRLLCDCMVRTILRCSMRAELWSHRAVAKIDGKKASQLRNGDRSHIAVSKTSRTTLQQMLRLPNRMGCGMVDKMSVVLLARACLALTLCTRNSEQTRSCESCVASALIYASIAQAVHDSANGVVRTTVQKRPCTWIESSLDSPCQSVCKTIVSGPPSRETCEGPAKRSCSTSTLRMYLGTE
mmetsp:Transcript_6740/g.12794  ORF Transcript_6740/g.12794 Transcript_6740/m.12794 type:complete len:207 (+) Transcript_6740:262-882(+)